MFALMGIKALYRDYLQQLSELYPGNEAATMLDRLFESVANIQRADIIKNPSWELPDPTAIKLEDLFIQLLQYRPLQYVLGEAWFYDMRLHVNEHVLIPRPETEELVELVIEDAVSSATDKHKAVRLLDIGTGSGCIAIALKKQLAHADIIAIDVSADALEVARKNARDQQVSVVFQLLDFLSEAEWPKLPVFDVIVSNPPYIPLSEKERLDKNVSNFEPQQALFVPDKSPLLFYQKIAAFGIDHLSEQGKIFVEIHEDYAKETAELFGEYYQSVQIINDLFGKERMIVISAMRHR